MEEERLDKILIQRQLVTTRVRAEKIIRETGVKVNGQLVTKTGKKFPVDCVIEMLAEELPWVSRGAVKLLEAIGHWQPSIEGKTFLDIGASTGGFTEVLLKNGAARVYCVDVGRDQLHASLKGHDQVVNLERTHVRELTTKQVPELVDGCVIDVSFISLTSVFPFVHHFIKEGGFVIALVKPQFEVGKKNVGKGGIVRDKQLYPEVLDRIRKDAASNRLEAVEHIGSPILGGDGNQEFLLMLRKI